MKESPQFTSSGATQAEGVVLSSTDRPPLFSFELLRTPFCQQNNIRERGRRKKKKSRRTDASPSFLCGDIESDVSPTVLYASPSLHMPLIVITVPLPTRRSYNTLCMWPYTGIHTCDISSSTVAQLNVQTHPAPILSSFQPKIDTCPLKANQLNETDRITYNFTTASYYTA